MLLGESLEAFDSRKDAARCRISCRDAYDRACTVSQELYDSGFRWLQLRSMVKHSTNAHSDLKQFIFVIQQCALGSTYYIIKSSSLVIHLLLVAAHNTKIPLRVCGKVTIESRKGLSGRQAGNAAEQELGLPVRAARLVLGTMWPDKAWLTQVSLRSV
jgi:hypothetical protein